MRPSLHAASCGQIETVKDIKMKIFMIHQARDDGPQRGETS
jgi:hypothetical protein